MLKKPDSGKVTVIVPWGCEPTTLLQFDNKKYNAFC